jgi:hypothetical protein
MAALDITAEARKAAKAELLTQLDGDARSIH